MYYGKCNTYTIFYTETCYGISLKIMLKNIIRNKLNARTKYNTNTIRAPIQNFDTFIIFSQNSVKFDYVIVMHYCYIQQLISEIL